MRRILLLQNDPLVGRKMRDCIDAEPGWEVSGLVSTLSLAQVHLRDDPPDLLLADLILHDGPLLALLNSRHRPPDDGLTRLLVSILSIDDERLMPALRFGADAYLLHGQPCAALTGSVRQVLEGGSPMTPSIARVLRTCFAAVGWPTLPGNDGAHDRTGLTASEGLLLTRLCEGYGAEEIAAELQTSVQQLGLKARSLYRKFRAVDFGVARAASSA